MEAVHLRAERVGRRLAIAWKRLGGPLDVSGRRVSRGRLGCYVRLGHTLLRMHFQILGPFEVDHDGRRLPLGGHQQRALLALLLLRANEVVPVDEIIEALWPNDPPPSATKSVHVLVSKLRRTLEGHAPNRPPDADGNGILLTRPHGYVLSVAPGELDLDLFQSLLDEGRAALTAGRAEEAAAKIREALRLWRGPPLGEFAYDSFAQVEIARLEALRLSAIEDRIDADLALRRHDELVPELEALVAKHPLRERLRAQLMLALYRCGRQAEALEVYQDSRRVLTGELGLEPSRQLQELERAILTHDPSLEILPSVAPLRRRRRSALALGLGGVLALGAAVAVLLVVTSGGDKNALLAAVEPNAVGLIDSKSDRLVGQVPVGSRPSKIVVGEGAVWVLNSDDRTISRIDPQSRSVRTFSAGSPVVDLAAGAGKVWVAHGSAGTVALVDPDTTIVERTIRLPRGSLGPPTAANGVAVRDGTLWVSGSANHFHKSLVWRINAATNEVTTRRRLPDGGGAIAVGAKSAWIRGVHGVVRLDARTGAYQGEVVLPMNAAVGEESGAVTVGASGTWVASTGDDVVWHIDPGTGLATGTVPFRGRPTGLAARDRSLWIADLDRGRIVRYDTIRQRVVRSIHIGGQPSGVAVGAGAVWVSVD